MKKTRQKTKGTGIALMEALLRENGFKVTPPRIAVLSLFSEKCDPMSAEQIFEKISAKNNVDLVTVYRTMTSFEKKGIVRRVDLHKDAVFFELGGDHHHHHIICTDCGKIEKFEKCVADSLVKSAASHSSQFTEIKGHSLEFFGTCKSCIKTVR